MNGNFHGDLADVVRDVVGNPSLSNCSSFPVSELPVADPLNIDEGFGYPFSSMRDPLLTELEVDIHGDFIRDLSDDTEVVLPDAFQISSISGNISDDLNCTGFAPVNPSSPKTTSSSSLIDTSRVQISSPRNTIIKRRKSQAKKVVCIPAPTTANIRQGGGEVVPSDLWAWRKYGQKPIKGSPYPRGYYRCSSSKGCSARKQVERSRTDPNMLVITYTSEHNHPWPTQRNSLAGSSRISASTSSSSSKPSPPPLTTAATVKEEKTTVDDSSIKTVHETINNRIEPEDQSKRNGVVVMPSQMSMNELVFDYNKSYRPVMQDDVTNSDNHHQDFFAELRELEEIDPLNKSMLEIDPFSSLFDWSSNSTSNNDEYRNRHENSS
uniref:WRKY transcription factor n=1 Tax=Fagopyrum tataricum TaxID=62330 RepID=A0A4P9Q2T9_FAGTA|nr:WRKY transcription factor [Fagopyrum tataricum]